MPMEIQRTLRLWDLWDLRDVDAVHLVRGFRTAAHVGCAVRAILVKRTKGPHSKAHRILQDGGKEANGVEEACPDAQG